jgi:hypothetical protein
MKLSIVFDEKIGDGTIFMIKTTYTYGHGHNRDHSKCYAKIREIR